MVETSRRAGSTDDAQRSSVLRRRRGGYWYGVTEPKIRFENKLGLWEFVCLAVFLGLTAWQLFFFPSTGLSDNNDFAKVLGPAHICKEPVENLNTWFVSDYAAGPQCARASGFTSSEILFVDVARFLSRPFTGRYHFDIRSSAAVHLLVLTAAMALFLTVTRRQRPLVRFLLPPLAIFMFSDVAYVAYLNSAYMDNASWVLFLLLTAIVVVSCTWRGSLWMAGAYAMAGLLLVFSKAQHAILGIAFAGLAGYFAWRNRDGHERAAWSIGGIALLAATAVMPALTPTEYQNISLYNVIFHRLASEDRPVLGELGLDASYEQWIGVSPFAANSPLPNPDWSRAFVSKVSFGDVALLYLEHPGIALREIDRELHDSVHAMRPDYMANYRREDGFAPHTAATRFSWWSSLRMRVLTKYPYALVVVYLLPLAAVVMLRGRGAILPLALVLVAAGVGEFGICTLADAIDTHRHLFLFHVITDALLLAIVGGALAGSRQLDRRRATIVCPTTPAELT